MFSLFDSNRALTVTSVLRSRPSTGGDACLGAKPATVSLGPLGPTVCRMQENSEESGVISDHSTKPKV